MSDSVNKDFNYVWHPFTHLKNAEIPLSIVRSKGAYYYSEEGNRYIDAISSWWVNIHGHSHPYIAKKVYQQAKNNAHSIFSGFTHPQAIRLSERILKIIPGNLDKVFFSDNGSTAVEVALKMALQYFHNKGKVKTKIIAIQNAYHGDTFGAMSVGARNVFTNAFSDLLFDVVHISIPYKNNNTNKLELKKKCFEIIKELVAECNTAAFIFEPIVQGAGGMLMYDLEVLDEIICECKKAEIICIADEVMTGFGRTGKMFATEYLTNKADIVCLSKGLTGGFMPLGITACAKFIHDAFYNSEKTKTFFHGHSYTANPIACSAANASLDLFEIENTMEQVLRISESHKKFAIKISLSKKLKEVRCIGTIIVFELETSSHAGYLDGFAEKISSFFLSKRIVLRPLGNVFYILPPYCIKQKDLNYIYKQVQLFLKTI